MTPTLVASRAALLPGGALRSEVAGALVLWRNRLRGRSVQGKWPSGLPSTFRSVISGLNGRFVPVRFGVKVTA